jgi:hypothetical protein
VGVPPPLAGRWVPPKVNPLAKVSSSAATRIQLFLLHMLQQLKPFKPSTLQPLLAEVAILPTHPCVRTLYPTHHPSPSTTHLVDVVAG